MSISKPHLAALLSGLFLVLVVILTRGDILSASQMKAVVLFGPILIFTMLLPRSSCRLTRGDAS